MAKKVFVKSLQTFVEVNEKNEEILFISGLSENNSPGENLIPEELSSSTHEEASVVVETLYGKKGKRKKKQTE